MFILSIISFCFLHLSVVSTSLIVNLTLVIDLNSTNYSYSYSDTFLFSSEHFIIPSSDQIANDIIHFLVQASPQTSPNNLQLVVFENMLNKYFKQILISHIDSLLLAFINRDYKHLNQSFAALSHISDFDKYASSICILVKLILNLFDRNSIYRNKFIIISIIIRKF